MRRVIDSIALLSLIIIFSSSAAYTIYYKGSEAGQYYVDYNYPHIQEKVLWTDGFSKQYTEALHDFYAGYSLKSYSYIRNNALPNTVAYEGNVLNKRIGSIMTRSVMNKPIDMILDMSCPLGAVIYMHNSMDKLIYNITNDNLVKVKHINNQVRFVDGIPVSVFGQEFYPDSIHWSHYRFIKNEYARNVINPFKRDMNTLSREHFNKKPIQKKIRIGDIVGELSMNGNETDIAVILPFDMRSDRYGNMYNVKAYTTYQLAQQLNCAVFVFDFLGLRSMAYDELKSQVKGIEQYFSHYFDNVTFIAFNDMCPLAMEAVNARIIAFNPPLCRYDKYEQIMFSRLNSSNDFIYSSLHSFRQYNVLGNAYRDMDFIEMYNMADNLFIIVSSDVLDAEEMAGLNELDIKYTRISNVDRRLNSYIIDNDLHSYRHAPVINKSIITYINNQL